MTFSYITAAWVYTRDVRLSTNAHNRERRVRKDPMNGVIHTAVILPSRR